MSDKDKQLLADAGLTVQRAAALLEVTRQAFYNWFSDPHTSHIDNSRATRIYRALTSASEFSEAANFLAACSKHEVKVGLLAAGTNDDKRDIYCIFTSTPMELRDPEYLDEYMAQTIFPNCRVVSYFLTNDDHAHTLVSEIKAAFKARKVAWSAKIYVFVTNAIYFAPHIAFTKTTAGFYNTYIYSNKKGLSDHIEATDSFVTQIKTSLRKSNFNLDPSDAEPFYSPNEYNDISGLNGIFFKLIGAINE